MKKCIFLPGDLTGSFVVNELQFLRNAFDDVFVLSYIENEGSFDEIIKRFGFRGCLLKRPSFLPFKLLKWNRCDYVKEEKNTAMKAGNYSFKTLVKRYIYLQMYGAYALSSDKIISEEINNFDGDVYIYAFWLSRPAFTASQYNGKVTKIISRAHGYDLYEYRNSTNYLPFRKFIQNNLDDIYFISDDGKRYFENLLIDKKVPLDKGASHKISRLGTFSVENIDFENASVENDEIITIASCSSIVELKRLDLIIDSIKVLQDRFGANRIKWIHLGDGPLMSEMKQYATKLADGSYEFVGNIPNEFVTQKYLDNNVQFFINMSDYEGVPVSLMEAMSVGLFPIARNVGGISEIINNDNGLLLEDIDFDKIGDFVEVHCKDKYSEAAYKKWNEVYNADKNYKSFFEEVIA